MRKAILYHHEVPLKHINFGYESTVLSILRKLRLIVKNVITDEFIIEIGKETDVSRIPSVHETISLLGYFSLTTDKYEQIRLEPTSIYLFQDGNVKLNYGKEKYFLNRTTSECYNFWRKKLTFFSDISHIYTCINSDYYVLVSKHCIEDKLFYTQQSNKFWIEKSFLEERALQILERLIDNPKQYIRITFDYSILNGKRFVDRLIDLDK